MLYVFIQPSWRSHAGTKEIDRDIKNMFGDGYAQKTTLGLASDLRGATWVLDKQWTWEGRREGGRGRKTREGVQMKGKGCVGGLFFFYHKGREEMMWEKQTGSLAGLPNVWKGPHWVNKALTGEELTTTRHHARTHTHTHTHTHKYTHTHTDREVEINNLCAII